MEDAYRKDGKEVSASLGTDLTSGLAFLEVEKRKKIYGLNELPTEKPPSGLFIFIKQFNNFFSYLLLIAIGVTLFLQEYVDAVAISIALFANVAVGYVQENRAQKTITQLRKFIIVTTKTLREKEIRIVRASDLVPGDIIYLDAGDRVPADARLLDAVRLTVHEQALTGESVAIKKRHDVTLGSTTVLGDRNNMLYMGTTVAGGKATAVVTATGLSTELGKIAKLVKEAEDAPTPLQREMKRLSLSIGSIALGVCFLVFILGLILGKNIADMFVFAVALAVSAVPEGLAIIVTIILAVGMRRILKRRAAVRELISAETLGSTTVICSDKTGTMTTGEMRVEKIVLADASYTVADLDDHPVSPALTMTFTVSALCHDLHIENPALPPTRWKILGDPTEKALLEAAIRGGMDTAHTVSQYPQIDEIPFDSYIKMMATAHTRPNGEGVAVMLKGATERVLAWSHMLMKGSDVVPFTDQDRAKLLKQSEELSLAGYRVIATAYKYVAADTTALTSFELDDEKQDGYTFTGILAIRDPIREEIKESITLCARAGIHVKMITGDHRLTAASIAKEIGLPLTSDDQILDGVTMDQLSAQELEERISQTLVFARVAPAHKLKIVDVLQRKGEVVAMTGDGVNDSPALRKADIGIAMGSGTEVAKETSDMILLDNNFQSIVAAVEEGRIIFDNIRKTALYLLSNAFSEIIVIATALIAGWPLPLLPTQILWINLVTDSFPSLALTMEAREPELMREPPRKREERVLDKKRKTLIGLVSVIMGITTLALYYYLWVSGKPLLELRTVSFTALAVTGMISIFSIRSLRHGLFHIRTFSNPHLLLAVALCFLAQIGVVYIPLLQTIFHTTALPLADWGFVLAEVVVTITAIEIAKKIFLARKHASRPL